MVDSIDYHKICDVFWKECFESDVFWDECFESINFVDNMSDFKRWKYFIEKKDLGIEYNYAANYSIVDEKKWLLSKLKYGL